MHVSIRLASLGTLLLSTALGAQDHGHGHPPANPPPTARLGTVHFPTSGSPAAQREFVRGISYLHSFTYEAAARAFREAERADAVRLEKEWDEEKAREAEEKRRAKAVENKR